MDDTQIANIVSDFREGIQGSTNLYRKLRAAARAELAELRQQYDDQAHDLALERRRADTAERKLAALVEAAQPLIDAHYDPGILPANVTAQMITDLERAVAMAQED